MILVVSYQKAVLKLKHEVFVCMSNVELTSNDPNVLQGAGNLDGLKL